MKVLVLQHVPFEGIGNMSHWLELQKAEVQYTRFFEDTSLPRNPKSFNLVIVMGGPMSANDELTIPWLKPEKRFIQKIIKLGIPLIGICLGAQLIASSLNARVYKNLQKEIGWFPIKATLNSKELFKFPDKCLVFHWHGETFDLPKGAVRLATSEACENQSFQLGKKVIGLQFHLEMTSEGVSAILDKCKHELVPGPYIQTEAELKEVKNITYTEINRLMNKLLSYICPCN